MNVAVLPRPRFRRFSRSPGLAQDKPYAGITLNVASQNDQFAAVMADLAPQFTEKTGATVKVDILSYPELLTKVTSDYIGDTKGYDIATMDIVWAGQFAETGWTVELSDLIKRDAAEINVDDIYPILMNALGNYGGKQVAFPFAGYANVLAYRTDLYEAAGLQPPKTMEELVADAKKLTDPSKPVYGFVANGQKGPAVAQDWMQYNAQMGGSIVDGDGKPAAELRRQREEPRSLQGALRRGRASGRRRLRLGRARGELPPGARREHADLVGRRRRLRRPVAVEGRRQVRHQARASGRGPAEEIRRRRLGPCDQRRYRREAAGSGVGVHQVDHQPRGPQGDEHARREQLSRDQRDARRRSSRQVPVPAGHRRDLHERRRRLSSAHPAISADPGHPRARR